MEHELIRHECILRKKLYNKFSHFKNIIFEYKSQPFIKKSITDIDQIKRKSELCNSDFMFTENIYCYNYILNIYNHNLENNTLELKLNKLETFDTFTKTNKIILLQKMIEELD
jgi:hypothetical protein